MADKHGHQESLRPHWEIAVLVMLAAIIATYIAIDNIGAVTIGKPYGLLVLGAVALFLIQVAATIFGLLLLRSWTRPVDSPPQPPKTS